MMIVFPDSWPSQFFSISPVKGGLRAAVKLLLLAVLLSRAGGAQSTAPQTLRNHLPAAVISHQTEPRGALAGDQKMQLSIVLPLRNQARLKALLDRLYDPSSADYHKFLSVQTFTDQFGPTAEHYQAVVDFATANGFTVTGRAANRLVVSIAGSAAQVNSAFHVQLNLYQHPTEARLFFSPDREPSVFLGVPLAHIDGMNNYSLPRPAFVPALQSDTAATPTGSGPGASFLGSDMRAAYYGGTTLSGAGQTVGLVEFGGYEQSDVDLSFSNAGQSYSVPIENVLVGGATDTIYENDTEAVLDIVQAIGMAPGLDQVRVYMGDPYSSASPAAVLSEIASENAAKQIACAWSWIPDDLSSEEALFEEMAAQGQSFFAAAGDYGAYQYSISPYFYPAESAYVTTVGGTHLTTSSASGAWASETAWNANGYGSGGGVSPDGVVLPSWQAGVTNAGNGGSSTLRNVPDVAMEADFGNYFCSLGTCSNGGAGTSFATPRWAAFIALANQQAVALGNAPEGGIGFINPVIYALGAGSSYGDDFHDVQSGNNDTEDQTTWYSATSGYDLVTGWGSPAGQSLIDALAGKLSSGFWLAASKGAISVVAGSSSTATISVVGASGFTGNVDLSIASSLPAGVTAAFTPASTSSSSVLTLTASSATAAGTYPVTIAGTSGSITETTTVHLAVSGAKFTLSTSALRLSVEAESSSTATVTVNDMNGFTDSVNLAASGLPAGVTAAWSANPASASSVLTLTAGSAATAGTSTVTIMASYGSLTATTTLVLTVIAPSFTLASAPAAVELVTGGAGSSTVTIAALNGFSGSVSLAISGLPGGVTAAWSQNPATASSVLTLTAGSTAAVGSVTATIAGSSGALSATALLPVTVRSTPTITWATPAAIVYGTALSATQLDATANVPGSFVYSPAAGSVLAIGSNRLSAVFTPDDASDYLTATAAVTLAVHAAAPILASLSPAVITAGSAAFTLTANGVNFTSSSQIYWGSSALTTTYVSGTALSAQVPSADAASAGTAAITVQTPSPGGGGSNALELEIGPADSSSASFSALSATVVAGAAANYPVILPTGATNVTVSCLNLPAGATCGYANGVLTIATSTSTPAGSYQIVAVFTETLSGAAPAWLLLPFGVLPFTAKRRRLKRGLLALGLMLIAMQWMAAGCGGANSTNRSTTSYQTTSSGAVTLIVE